MVLLNFIQKRNKTVKIATMQHYMMSYMKYILSKFTIIVLMPTESLSVTKHVQKCARNRPTNKKNSHFEENMGFISN